MRHGTADLRPPRRAQGIGRPGQRRLVLPETARVRPDREVGREGQPRADDIVVLDVGDRQVAQRLRGIEERREVDVESGQVTLDRGDGDLPGRGLVGAPHESRRSDTSGMVEHQRLGDPAAERMTGDVHGIGPAQVIENRQCVRGHNFHAVGSGGDEDGATPRLSKVAT